MRIKTHFAVLFTAITLIPLLCLIGLPIYHYCSSPQRILLKGYKQVRSLGNIDISDNDWEVIKENLKHLPPNVQICVVYGSQIIISNYPDLKAGTYIAPFELYSYISSTSNDYDYQFQSPTLKRKHVSLGKDNLLFITRSKVPDAKNRKDRFLDRFLLPLFIGILLFETICLTLVSKLSSTILSSITLLEKNTNRIANGELNLELEHPKGYQNTNEITSLTDNLEKMRCSLKEEQERRSKFIMGLSHDLRTPVALIKGYTEAITDGVVSDREQILKSLSIVHNKADQLEGMINDLINYIKLENSDWLRTLENVEIYPILVNFGNGCVQTGDVYKRNITSSINIREDIKVPMDKTLFNRAMENLFSNALRYTKDGDSISFNAWEEDNCIKVSVKDTGKGIEKKDIEHIYDMFYRGTNSRRETGMGIGLSVVKNIIDTHGWKIEVSSEINKGTEFIVSIPLQK